MNNTDMNENDSQLTDNEVGELNHQNSIRQGGGGNDIDMVTEQTQSGKYNY